MKLSDKFYHQVTDRPVPVDLRAIRALKKSPLALDLYAFTTYRVSYLNRRVEIPWEALMMQLGADYQDNAQGKADFKRKLLAAMRKVATVYPELRAEQGDRGLVLLPSPTHVAKKHGVSEQTLYVWRKRYGQLEAADVKQLRGLQQENARLKKLLAERDLEIEVMKEVTAKKW